MRIILVDGVTILPLVSDVLWGESLPFGDHLVQDLSNGLAMDDIELGV